MAEIRRRRHASAVMALLVVAVALGPVPVARAVPAAAPQEACGPGALLETDVQGRVPTADYDSGRTALGYQCNAEQVGHEGASGGFRVHRYVDGAGHECAFYDTTLLVGTSLLLGPSAGVAVLDMTDPSRPVRTATLVTPAMLSPHESLNLNERRGLLAAIMGSPVTAPGIVDIYDVSADCRYPVLRFTGPIGGAGHEATFAPDGNTFYTAATALDYVTALDVTNPSLPRPVWTSTDYRFHGMNVSDDGNRLYAADLGSAPSGFTILDVSEVQARVPNPAVRKVSNISWPNVSIPQTAIPVTIGGHPFVVEVDEFVAFGPGEAAVGAARIIDIADETAPFVVSQMRLDVNDPPNRTGPPANDPGAADPLQGYAGHYCAVPRRTDPEIVACSFIISGLRVFDIRDPAQPREIAYFNPPSRDIGAPAARVVAAATVSSQLLCRIDLAATAPRAPAPKPLDLLDIFRAVPLLPFYGSTLTHWAMSAPTFVPERNEVWYSDGMYGFYAVTLTNDVWNARAPVTTGGEVAAGGDATATAPTEQLPPTGRSVVLAVVVGLFLFAASVSRSRQSAT